MVISGATFLFGLLILLGMVDLIIKTAVKEETGDMEVGSDFYVALDEEVAELLEDARQRAKANDRNTVSPESFYCYYSYFRHHKE